MLAKVVWEIYPSDFDFRSTFGQKRVIANTYFTVLKTQNLTSCVINNDSLLQYNLSIIILNKGLSSNLALFVMFDFIS